MTRLIDADKLFEKVGNIKPKNKSEYELLGKFMNMITYSPTVGRAWIPVTYRPMDAEEYEDFKKEFGELPVESRKMFSCQMPEDDQEILICTSWGGVSQDRCEIDEYGYALETQGDWDGVTAWMPLPDPYKKEGEAE